MDHDEETESFISYWFADEQRGDIARLAAVLKDEGGPIGDALRLSLSRIIVTKDRGASLARDVSHSRPHRVRETNDYDVCKGFSRSVEQLATRLDRHPPCGSVVVESGDARDLPLDANCVDAVLTSPPYLNAIDYLRGHRMALVWLGFDVRYLRAIRSTSIGTEKGLAKSEDRRLADALAVGMGTLEKLGDRDMRMVLRYVLDMFAAVSEIARVLRVGGTATLVVGNSSLRGVYVANDACIASAADRVGLSLIDRSERPLPASRRYLPPPNSGDSSHLHKRMRTEVVLKFKKA